MPFSEFVKLYKAASMLDARSRLADLQTVGFPHYSETDRNKLVRDLRDNSNRYLEKALADFKSVVSSIAKRLRA